MERLSLSEYRDKFILKGGTLIAAMVGLDARSTMDIDATIKNLTLTESDAIEIVKNIGSIPLNDGMTFGVKNAQVVMEGSDYPGIRVVMEATLDRIRIPMKIDFSTGDVITPKEIIYSMKLLFEERSIAVLAYNVETVLAEKMETVLARGVANTRMRDFYDMYILETLPLQSIDYALLKKALLNTCTKRNTSVDETTVSLVLGEVDSSAEMLALWMTYRKKFEYANGVEWSAILAAVGRIFKRVNVSIY